MQNRREFEPQHLSPIADPTPESRRASEVQVKTSDHRLTFINSVQGVRRLSAENAAKHRHAIFTESERLQMSENVSNSLVNRDPDQALLELDRLEFSTDNVTQFSLFRGPFGVSKIDQSPETDQTSPEDESVILPVEDWLVEPSVFSSTIRESEDTGFIDTFSDILNTGSPIWDLIPTTAENTEKHVPTPQLPLDILPITISGSTEAWSILSHYRDRVVPLISPFENGQEVPWRNLIIPCAVSTLGETFMNDSSSHARLALLNALLSASSFHLGQHSTMCIEHWTMAGSSYLKLAQHHLMKCIEDADMIHPRKSKYKEVLMALLSLSTAYMIKGDSEKRLSCLIQAERFISANGFTQSTVSSKRRALHHCYAYMRIMAETTSIEGLCADMANTTISEEEESHTGFRIYPGVTFTGDIMAMEKDPGVAQRDLHLAIPGKWSLTLFPKMYGVAEAFLMLLSQVIRLANERDLSMTEGREEGLNLKEFWTRAKVLEKGIHLLVASCRADDSHNGPGSENHFERLRAQAMYTALLIFFHRRIYDLDATLLQKEVDSVKHTLTKAQETANTSGANTATLIWPAFIAACEAVGAEPESFFSSWFDSCYATTGLCNVSLAKQVFEAIWNRRRQTGLNGDMCSWPEILRVKKIRLMFI
ncbi:Protein of unknown function DUF3468 [Penicillium citrinum]|uniref:Arginine metabolism regulation protein II n=1 Tax=Penicillium citrinum TaxID=5077 RepID=A0A9W9P557_PENCI|nr:Protein of unknown function DUF3468 [Penicillium citrinum]KAJ5235466.1 Protein of unknown function DUF3468 [Penicillium citrinum]